MIFLAGSRTRSSPLFWGSTSGGRAACKSAGRTEDSVRREYSGRQVGPGGSVPARRSDGNMCGKRHRSSRRRQRNTTRPRQEVESGGPLPSDRSGGSMRSSQHKRHNLWGKLCPVRTQVGRAPASGSARPIDVLNDRCVGARRNAPSEARISGAG